MVAPIRLVALCFLLTVSGVAPAAVATWTLQDVDFTDGSEASGSFDWDSDTNVVLDWNLGLTDGTNTNFPAASFTPSDSTISFGNPPVFEDVIFNSSLFTFTDVIGTRGLSLRLGIGPLDNLDTPAKSLPLIPTGLTGNGAVICFNCTPFLFSTGTGSLSAVPEPTTLALLGLGLAGLGFARKRFH